MRFFCTENLVYNVHSETGSKFDKQIYKETVILRNRNFEKKTEIVFIFSSNVTN